VFPFGIQKLKPPDQELSLWTSLGAPPLDSAYSSSTALVAPSFSTWRRHSVQGCPKKVIHYHELSLNRIQTRHFKSYSNPP